MEKNRDHIIHKLTKPVKMAPVEVENLILCWNNIPANNIHVVTDLRVSTSINHVTCPSCIDFWHRGIYA